MRIFPLVLLIGPGIKLVQLYIAKREGISTNNELRRQLVHFFYWFLGASILFGLLGLFSGRGVNCWIEFLQKMSIHSSFIAGEGFNMGLRNFISALPIGGELAYVGYVLILSVVTWSFIKIIRELDNLVSLFSVSSILIYFLMTLSPYYYLLLAVLLLLPDTKASKFVSISLFGLLYLTPRVPKRVTEPNPRGWVNIVIARNLVLKTRMTKQSELRLLHSQLVVRNDVAINEKSPPRQAG